MKSAIQFPAETRWVALSQQETGRLMEDMTAEPLWFRVWLAALANMNRIGHAQFGSGELAAYVGPSVSTTTGEAKRYSASALSMAISRCKALGLLAPESRARCLVVKSTLAQRGGRGSAACVEHGVYVSARDEAEGIAC